MCLKAKIKMVSYVNCHNLHTASPRQDPLDAPVLGVYRLVMVVVVVVAASVAGHLE